MSDRPGACRGCLARMPGRRSVALSPRSTSVSGMVVHRLTVEQARRIAVHAQLLDLPRPTELVATVERLTFLQIDPTAAVAPSADLVLWSRLGPTYDPADLADAIDRRRVIDLQGMLRPRADIPL